jgi:CcdB protein
MRMSTRRFKWRSSMSTVTPVASAKSSRSSSLLSPHCMTTTGRRVVIPLVKASVLGTIANPRLSPTFKIKNIAVVLHPLEIVSVPVSVLGEPVASLKADAERVIGSLDDLLLRVDP